MPDYTKLFENEAGRYQELVAHEDPDGNLLKAVESVSPLHRELDVADIGAGTGRVSFLIAPRVGRVYGIEPARGMREQAEAIRIERGVDNVEFREGGYGSLPLPDKSVDLVIEGWSLLYYFVRFIQPDWRAPLERALAEMRRILKPGGTIIFIETLGTMEDEPVRFERAVPLYDYFEKDLGCGFTSIRTEFRFDSPEQAVALIGFFFGDEMAAVVKERNRPVVPSWTGVWWKRM